MTQITIRQMNNLATHLIATGIALNIRLGKFYQKEIASAVEYGVEEFTFDENDPNDKKILALIEITDSMAVVQNANARCGRRLG